MKIEFEGSLYQLVITDHAKVRMQLRSISEDDVVRVLTTGKKIRKESEFKYWVYKKLPGRKDNNICLSISIENPFLIVITALIKWRPT